MAEVLKFATVVGDSACLALSSAKLSSSSVSLIKARNTSLLLPPFITLRLSLRFIPIRCQHSLSETKDNNSATKRDLTIPTSLVESLREQLIQSNMEIEKIKKSIDLALEHLDKILSVPKPSSYEGFKTKSRLYF